ncbi:MAG: TolC family protein [Candidatus Omnitrophica bacterium]|nr:TolC family protein [Candidatus Omnitrophota bacterium]
MADKINMINLSGSSIATILLVFAALSLTGCQTLTAPSSSSEAWKAPSTKTDNSSWQSLRGQKIDSSKPLTLTDLVNLALQNNPSTKQAWNSARAAEAVKAQSESLLYPSATVTATLTREAGKANLSAADYNDLVIGPEIELTYLLLDFGGRAANIKQTTDQLLAANYQFNQSIQDLLFDVENTYYGFYSAKASLDAALADLETAKTAYDAADTRYRAQLASKLDVLQAKSTYEDSLFSLEGAKGQVNAAKAQLAQTIGISADTEFDIADPEKPLPTALSEDDVTKLINDAMDKRPDIAAQKATVESSKAAIKFADSALYPSISAGGTADINKYHYYGDTTARSTDKSYAAYLTFNWDLFDGFNNLNKKREAEMNSEVERAKLIEAQLAASADVWTKYYNFKTAVRQYGFGESLLETAQTSYELALESYNNGLKSMLDLINAQSQLSDARSKLIQTKKDLFVSLADLAHATGSLYAGDITNEQNK